MRLTGIWLSKIFYCNTRLGAKLILFLFLIYKHVSYVWPILQKRKVISSQEKLPNVSEFVARDTITFKLIASVTLNSDVFIYLTTLNSDVFIHKAIFIIDMQSRKT